MTKKDYEQAKREEYRASHMVAFSKLAAEAGFEVEVKTEDEYAKGPYGAYSLDVEVSMPYEVNGTTRKVSMTVRPADRDGWYAYRLFRKSRQSKDPVALVARLLEAVKGYQKRDEEQEAEETRENSFRDQVLGIVTSHVQAAQETDMTCWDYLVGNMKLSLDADAGVVTVQMGLKPEEFAKLMALGLKVEK